mmetsp:Transcript_3873/g.7236  ORF Transcript_3873/g.7236 Transcript_3873/m.7236 type:complete len:368 (+) Transcript_3873:181-1284(+)
MGCCGSKKSRGDAYRLEENKSGGQFQAIGSDGAGFGNTGFGSGGPAPTRPTSAPQQAARPDPKDFTFGNLKGEVKVREPGTVNGQQFIIDSCQDCDLYVLDHNAAITIDDCKNCRIFIGPCESSIFIRDCYNCKLVFFCRQFRTRNCEDCDFSLYCATRPIIESSKRLRFGCIDYHYEGLEEGMKACQLSKFTNYWSHIHDFTKAPNNWSLLPPNVRGDDLLAPRPAAKCLHPNGTPNPPPFVLRTWGERDPVYSETAFVLLPPSADQESTANRILKKTAGAAVLVHTNKAAVDSDIAKQLVQLAAGEVQGNINHLVKAMTKGKTIGLEFGGPGCLQAVKSALPPGDCICTANTQASSMFRYMGIEG